jgi:hypothetical protein
MLVELQEEEEVEKLVGLLLQGGQERECSHTSPTHAQRGCSKHSALRAHPQSLARSRAPQVLSLLALLARQYKY